MIPFTFNDSVINRLVNPSATTLRTSTTPINRNLLANRLIIIALIRVAEAMPNMTAIIKERKDILAPILAVILRLFLTFQLYHPNRKRRVDYEDATEYR